MFLKTKFSNVKPDVRFQQKRLGKLQNFRNPIGPVINKTKSRNLKKATKTGISQNFTSHFTTIQCSRQ